MVHSCAKAFCRIVGETNEAVSELKGLYTNFYRFLCSSWKSYADHHTLADAQRRSVIRSLFCLGALCRYYKFDGNPKPLPKHYDEIAKLTYGKHIEDAYGVFCALFTIKEVDVKAMALKAIGFLCINYPALLLRSEDIIRYASSSILKSTTCVQKCRS